MGTWEQKNVDLRQLSDRNHKNDRRTENTEPEVFGSRYEKKHQALRFQRR